MKRYPYSSTPLRQQSSYTDMIQMKVRAVLKVCGIVQGVGFRPFVYRLASRYNAKGVVQNSSDGVLIDIDIRKDLFENFMTDLQGKRPPLARIDSIETRFDNALDRSGFFIVDSDNRAQKTAAVSPDIAICSRCLKEMRDPKDRRYNYFFINCTNCGPRYTIIETLPYDRPNTSMNLFKICPECKKEYDSPIKRRYHAQPVSCFDCGPILSFLNNNQAVSATQNDAVNLTAALLKKGKIIAVKGLGGFHLMCDAANAETIKRLRKRKNRPKKPFAVMFPNLESIGRAANLDLYDINLLLSKERPIVLVYKRCFDETEESQQIPEIVAPDIDRIGAFLPYTPLHHLIFDHINRPLIATSANIGGEPIICSAGEIFERLGHVVDGVLDYNRKIVNACDDSVVQRIGKSHEMLRMSRGYAPKSFKIPFKTAKKILAVGAHQKNTIALAFGNQIIVSPHIGDLNGYEAFEYFKRTVQTFKRFYNFEPDTIVCDKHPEYETTKWALNFAENHNAEDNKPIEILKVQHHYAHLLACMAEYNIDEKVLGFAWDGTGYGDDETIWGGEIMIADTKQFNRIGYFYPVRLLGGEKAIAEPRRVALSMLFEKYNSVEKILSLSLPTIEAFGKKKIAAFYGMWRKGLNSPYSSSAGRIFDAVASLGGFVQKTSYEGQSGLEMEAWANPEIKEQFSYEIKNGIVSLLPMIDQIINLHQSNRDKKVIRTMIASMFINTLTDIIVTFCKNINLPVVLGGGVFQNRTLLESVIYQLDKMHRRYYIQKNTPVNDGGISMGQIWCALHNFHDSKNEQ